MKQPHYHGHRQRLKERFKSAGLDACADYELLELFLFYALPRGDVKPLAKALLHRFGSLEALMEADEKIMQEIEGVGPSISHLLKIHQALQQRQLRNAILKRPVLNSWQQVIDYCHAHMSYNMREQLRLLFLDKKNQLIAAEVQQIGTVDHTPAYPREIVKRALDLGASGIIMVHNHPTGDATPSRNDINLTREVYQVAQNLGLQLYDHLIIGKGCHTSLRSLGFID